MGFNHLRRKAFPTFQRTLLLSKSNNNNAVFHRHKNLSQRFTARNNSSRILMFQGNSRTFSSKTTDHHRIYKPPKKKTLVSYLPNRWRFIRQTLARASSDTSWLMERFLVKLGCVMASVIFSCSSMFIIFGCPRVGKERVPYTGRDHWVYERDRTWLARLVRAWQEEKMKTDRSILRVDSKESIRVQAVMEKLIQALNDSLRLENGCSLHFSGGNEEDEQLVITIEGNHNKKGSEKRADDAIKQNKTSTKHLEKKTWEVVVLDDSNVDSAYLLPCGILKIYSGLLDKLQDDTELATILAREIGCAVAQHHNEVSWGLQFIASIHLLPTNMGRHKKLLAVHPVCTFFSRRRDLEADYIGLMLMASAGYDPRVAPEVYPKLHSSRIEDYIFGYPSATKRKNKLQDAEVMGKAMAIYREVKEGREA